jgi:hypothetical protein
MNKGKVYTVVNGESFPLIKTEFIIDSQVELTTENDIIDLKGVISELPLEEYLNLINLKLDESINYFKDDIKCRLKFSEIYGRIELLLTRKQMVLEYKESLLEEGNNV